MRVVKELLSELWLPAVLIAAGVLYLRRADFPFGYALPEYQPEQTMW